MVRIRTSVVSWQLHMFTVCKETTLVMSGLMPAASILLFMLVQKTYLHHGSALMRRCDGLVVSMLFCYLIINLYNALQNCRMCFPCFTFFDAKNLDNVQVREFDFVLLLYMFFT